jgi:hypothetical protein
VAVMFSRPAQTTGVLWHLRRWPAGLDGRVPTRRLQHYKHLAWSCAGGAPTRAVAGVAAADVSPRHAPEC